MSNSTVTSVDFEPKVFNVAHKTPKAKLPLLIATFFLFILTIFIVFLVNNSSNGSSIPLTGKLIKIPTSKPKTLQGGSNTPNTTQTAKVTSFPVASNPEVIPGCSSVAKPQFSAPALNVDNPGVFVGDPIVAYYQVFGNNRDQINSQINTCSPVVIGGEKYAASTDYSISWVFNSTVNEQGLCKIQNVSVGVRNAFILPSWQRTGSSSNQIAGTWTNFIAHLTEHEYGHANINVEYARKMRTEIQNTPVSNCDSINEIAHSKARGILNELNNANDQYDASTNHGEHQGAFL